MIIRLVNANLGKASNIESDVETWGELQANEEVQSFMSGNTQAVVRETQNILDLDQAELPTEKLTSEDKEHDFTLFFVTKKSKAGSEDYDNWSFRQLRAEAASRDSVEPTSPGNYGSKEDIIEKLKADDEATQPESVCEADGSQLDRIEQKLDEVLSYIQSDAEVVAGVAEEDEEEEEASLSEDEAAEFNSIANQIG